MDERERLKTLLLQLSYEKKTVTLSSGRTSDFYIDVKQTSLHPEGACLLGGLLNRIIVENFSDARAIGGPTLGADPLVTAVAFASHLSQRPLAAFIVRKEPKSHGTEAWIEGTKNLQKGMPVVLVEDVLTTGSSLLKAAARVEEAGLVVVGMVLVVDREEGGKEEMAKRGYQIKSLFTRSELLS